MHKEPLIRISKRDSISKYWAWGIRGIALVLGLLLSSLIMLLMVKVDPIKLFASMYDGNFKSMDRAWPVIRDTMMLTCIAIGLAPAFRMRFWNIGAEGQILVGGLATAAWLIYFAGKMPVPLLFVGMIASAVLAGALWGVLPGLFKAKWNTNETLFTLMMNYIAIQLTKFFMAIWEKRPNTNNVGTFPRGNSKDGIIGSMFKYDKAGFVDYYWVILIVLVVVVLMYCYMRYTKHGYEIGVVGESENTAKYAGIRVPFVYVRTMALSGAVEGFSGFLAVAAVSYTISTETAGGRGFTAIIVAWLAKMNPFVMILISALLTFLNYGAKEIASVHHVNEEASKIMIGIVLFFILGSEFFINYKIKLRSLTAGKEA